jgi:aspartate/methionine/tyrosine aminotransferase
LWSEETHPVATRGRYRANFKVAEQILHNRFGYFTPGGGFFLWLDVGDGEAATRKLWGEAHVKVLPGAYLCRDTNGANPARRYIRVALVQDEKTTREALGRLASVL